MKIRCIILICVVTLFTSCRENNDVSSILKEADQLMEERGDSAFFILNTITKPEKLKGEEQAKYGLLFSKASIINGYRLTSDSLISIAHTYAVSVGDSAFMQQSAYWRGVVWLNLGDMNNEQIDEKNGRIYLLPWSAKNLLVYDLTGKYLESIPLGTIAAKGKFFVNQKESVIGVAQLATSEQEAIAYSMKTSGERIGSIKPRHLAVSGQGIFNNEVISDKNTDANDVSFLTMPRKPDTLYHYDIKNNALVPRLTTDCPEQVEMNSYTELPNHYMATVAVNEQVTETTTNAKERRYYVVDKETMKGSFFNLKNDFLGGMDIDRPYFGRPIFSFRNGYYLENMDPSNLQEAIAKHLSSNQDMTAEMRDKLTKLSGSISENDNNYILYAKLKK